ncbi:hypothetical protein DdX_16548 [Ditylenchus destructor]|uniref:Uncharacterized protein n=1 Tax=Ditylenchus destructor TaxID=166010 RepID=A0AAD4QWK2_9BILA|nr:hypothetical protein DdX_16548 [Ditylenchus destructor]
MKDKVSIMKDVTEAKINRMGLEELIKIVLKAQDICYIIPTHVAYEIDAIVSDRSDPNEERHYTVRNNKANEEWEVTADQISGDLLPKYFLSKHLSSFFQTAMDQWNKEMLGTSFLEFVSRTVPLHPAAEERVLWDTVKNTCNELAEGIRESQIFRMPPIKVADWKKSKKIQSKLRYEQKTGK